MSIIVKDLSIIIPAYNEEQRILPTLEVLLKYCEQSPLDIDIIVVDDGSSDATAQIVEQLNSAVIQVVRLNQNQGKFAAIRAGISASERSWVLLYDADSATPIEMLDTFLPHTSEAQCIIASRAVQDADISTPQSQLRMSLGRFGNLLIRKLTGLGFHDTQCGFKLIRADMAKKASTVMKINRYAGDIELLYLIQKNAGAIQERGVTWHDVPISKVRWVDYPKTLLDLLRIIWNIKTGVYS